MIVEEESALAHRINEHEAARLARLPRAERFEALIEFPTRHLFKVIGPSDGLSDAVQQALTGLGFGQVLFVERYSAKGRHVSLTFELSVGSGIELDSIYSALEQVEGVAYLL